MNANASEPPSPFAGVFHKNCFPESWKKNREQRAQSEKNTRMRRKEEKSGMYIIASGVQYYFGRALCKLIFN